MNTIYTIYLIFLIALSIVINVLVTLAMPWVKTKWSAVIHVIKRKFTRTKPAIDATTYMELVSRIEVLEAKVNKRQNNFKQRVREEVMLYLKELQK